MVLLKECKLFNHCTENCENAPMQPFRAVCSGTLPGAGSRGHLALQWEDSGVSRLWLVPFPPVPPVPLLKFLHTAMNG